MIPNFLGFVAFPALLPVMGPSLADRAGMQGEGFQFARQGYAGLRRLFQPCRHRRSDPNRCANARRRTLTARHPSARLGNPEGRAAARADVPVGQHDALRET